MELCPSGALAFLFFVYCHVKKGPAPPFAPDFQAEKSGEFGRRHWYGIHVFFGKDAFSPMSYDSECILSQSLPKMLISTCADHYARIRSLHEAKGVALSKATHAGRSYTAKTAREWSASCESTKALGNWSSSGSYRACYDRQVPIDALLGAAMFNAQKPEDHFLEREQLGESSSCILQ